MPKVNLKVPKLSGFDKSHHVLLTGMPGTLVPVLADEVPAKTPIDLETVLNASMAPLASDCFMKVDLKVEAFFVPNRLLYGGYMDWLTGQTSYDPALGNYQNVGIPHATIQPANDYSSLGPGTLSDYLGMKFDFPSGSFNAYNVNLLPFLAYHRIYDDWYRAPLVQKKVFNAPVYDSGFAGVDRISSLPFVSFKSGSNKGYLLNGTNEATFDDGVPLRSLRQRNFGFDYFTTALPAAQLGSAKGVSFTVSGGAGSISIAAIRAANSLQQFAERNELAGFRYEDYLRANYGADLSSGVAQRAILLGSGEVPVYSKGVYQTSPYDSGSGITTSNPFMDSPAAQFGSVSCAGNVRLIKDFVAQEPGIVMVLVSLVPKATYSNGVDRMFFRYTIDESQTDLAAPILQNVGNQPVYQAELTGTLSQYNSLAVFGWQDRYSDFKYKHDRLAGLVRDGQTLDAFALQRTITGSPTINSQFLKIPTSFMDQVEAVSGSISQFGYWLDVFHHYRVSMPLSPFAIPSLQDPAYEHGEDVDVAVGGSRL